MTKRPALIWLTFALFLALALGAMGWMTRTVLRLDQAQARAQAAAQLEENVRLALWRMDGAIAPIISQETSRPYFEYSPMFPAERAYTRMYTELKSGDVLVPSPLLKQTSPYILLHFQIDPDGNVSSPQAPTGNVRKLAESRYTSAGDIAAAEERMGRIRTLVQQDRDVFASLPRPTDAQIWAANRIRVTANGSLSNTTINRDGYANNGLTNAQAQSPNFDVQQQAAVQQQRSRQEYAARAQVQSDFNEISVGNNYGSLVPPGVSFSVMRPIWTGGAGGGDTLLLARQVSINGGTYIQGCLLDWPAIRKWLLDSASDIVPQADLAPVHAQKEELQPRQLASIPARLELPPSAILYPPSSSSLFTPTTVTLLIAWLGVLLASAAVAVLLRGVIALSQRRAGFVSAVTHELRTPLTTLRMYTEMLADGMVSDPEKQAAYHKTLRAESNRLGHLVDNVLLYSRLERSTRDTKVESAPLAELLDRLTPRLADRAAQAGMSLKVSVADDARRASIRANLLSVEQILFNLVDNACKYAAAAPDRDINLTVAKTDRRIEIKVSDHGPGLDPLARSRLFQPFSKSVHEAANSAPGLGLGLALSYRLARNMNASLRHDPTPKSGATFILTLPS